jgi:hypothetical protein
MNELTTAIPVRSKRQLVKGDRVQFSPEALRTIAKRQREGVVSATPSEGSRSECVAVRWDGVKNHQYYHYTFLEQIL